MQDILLQILQHEYKPESCTNNAQSFKYLWKALTANNAISKSLLETEKYHETEVYEKNNQNTALYFEAYKFRRIWKTVFYAREKYAILIKLVKRYYL